MLHGTVGRCKNRCVWILIWSASAHVAAHVKWCGKLLSHTPSTTYCKRDCVKCTLIYTHLESSFLCFALKIRHKATTDRIHWRRQAYCLNLFVLAHLITFVCDQSCSLSAAIRVIVKKFSYFCTSKPRLENHSLLRRNQNLWIWFMNKMSIENEWKAFCVALKSHLFITFKLALINS